MKTYTSGEKAGGFEDKAQQLETTCGKCGGLLVLRKVPQRAFYGCSHFPNCRFTKPIDSK
ncbi:topoisomerase DNA-binding C4 zinc finger domain-containing protein [Paenibacillus terrae]|uniref:topoisomerase DNA-binding C4 zinc finger domain-containing protein n=1 Tax=Paenibacillus terrae TaxID=159743 RepID=UPI0009E2D430